MAEKASSDRVAADMQPPNFRSAVQIIRVGIQKKKEKIAEVNGQISEQWGKVEGFKVNKKAGRIFGTLDKLEQEERVEIMRSLNGLIDAAGWDAVAEDLVDAAQSNVVHLRVGGSAETGGAKEREVEGDDEDGDVDGAGEAEMQALEAAIEEPAKPRKAGRKPKEPSAAADKANGFLAKAAEQRRREAGLASNKPDLPPYTGDNADLAPE